MADFKLHPVDLELPTSREIVRNLDEYLNKKGVRLLFTEMAEMLLQRCPANPVCTSCDCPHSRIRLTVLLCACVSPAGASHGVAFAATLS